MISTQSFVKEHCIYFSNFCSQCKFATVNLFIWEISGVYLYQGKSYLTPSFHSARLTRASVISLRYKPAPFPEQRQQRYWPN